MVSVTYFVDFPFVYANSFHLQAELKWLDLRFQFNYKANFLMSVFPILGSCTFYYVLYVVAEIEWILNTCEDFYVVSFGLVLSNKE